MDLRKSVLISCIIISLFLFVDGVYAITVMSKRVEQRPNVPGKSEMSRTEAAEEKSSNTAVPVNMLILGLDEEEARSDVILLLNFSPAESRVNILSVARDTKVKVNGKTSKINALIKMGGEKLVMRKVEEMTGLPVSYYLTLNFKGFRKVIDTLDGVEVNVPINMDYDDPEQNLHIHLKKGKQLLDGNKAEQFVRYRKGNRSGQGYIDGDIGRIKAQQDFLRNLMEQKIRIKYLSKVDDIYFILKKYMRSNVELSDINYYLKYIRNIKYDNIKAYTLPGDSTYINNLWYFVYDVDETKRMIDNNFYK